MPTVISQARARADSFERDDGDLRAPPRRRAGAVRSSTRTSSSSPMSGTISRLMRPRLSKASVIGCAALCALMTGVVVNALYLQTEKHHAPLFTTATSEPAPTPLARPASLTPRAVEPTPTATATPTAAPEPAPRPALPRETTGSIRGQVDAIGGLIGGVAATGAARHAATRAAISAPKPPALDMPRATAKARAAAKPKAPAQASAPQKTRAAARTQEPARPQSGAKPQTAAKAHAAAKASAAQARRSADVANSARTTERISDEMRAKLATIGASRDKTASARATRRASAQDEE